MAAFSRKNSFAIVVKFFNMIGLALNSLLDLNQYNSRILNLKKSKKSKKSNL